MYTRKQTIKVMVGGVQIGHQNKVVIQSMTNTKTSDVITTVKQIKDLVHNGCELVRVAVLDQDDAKALVKVVKLSPCPIIADIHYNNHFAIDAINAGVSKIRINPGNIELKQLETVVKLAKAKDVAIRIGINQGSVGLKQKVLTPIQMVDQAVKYIKQFEKWGFNKIIVSLKTSNALTTTDVYKYAAQKIKYPLHLGVTEAGSKDNAVIKTAIGLVPVMQAGIGDTMRISISGNPINEPLIIKKTLNQIGLYKNVSNVIACPTCGRLQWNLEHLLEQVENYLSTLNISLKVAIMGCAVNGIGECLHADIGLYGKQHELVVYLKGKKYTCIKEADAFNELKKIINKHFIKD